MAAGSQMSDRIGEAASGFDQKGAAGMILRPVIESEAAEGFSLAPSQLSGGALKAVTVEFPFTENKRRERLIAAGRMQAVYADGVGAMRGFLIVLTLYGTALALGFGGWMLWYLLR